MKIRKSMLLAAASLTMIAGAAQAQEAPVEQAETTTDAAAEIEFLKAQVDALQTAIEGLQKKAGDNEASWKKAGWVNETKLSGRMYFNFSNIRQKANGVIVPATDKTTNFELKRFYLGVDHKFDDTFSANLTTDVTWQSGVGASLYIKKAYLQAKVSDALVAKLGATDMPWIPFVEGLYGYRHIDQTVSDRTKFGTSADWGLHAGGKLGENGMFEYAAALVNGAGYRNPPGVGGSNRSRSLDLEGRLSATLGDVVVGVGGYSGKLGKDVKPSATVPSPAINTATRLNGVVAYKGKGFTVGGEYFQASNWNNVTGSISTTADIKSNGWSAFGSVAFAPQWSAFGRYDWVKTNKLADTKDQYFNLGIQYSPAKIVDLALVYKRDAAANGSVSTGNGTIIGGTTAKGHYDEIGLFGQFRF